MPLPSTVLVWIQLLPLHIGGRNTFKRMEKIRVKTNNNFATYLFRAGEKYISYPKLHKANTNMFFKDKVAFRKLITTYFLLYCNKQWILQNTSVPKSQKNWRKWTRAELLPNWFVIVYRLRHLIGMFITDSFNTQEIQLY